MPGMVVEDEPPCLEAQPFRLRPGQACLVPMALFSPSFFGIRFHAGFHLLATKALKSLNQGLKPVKPIFLAF